MKVAGIIAFAIVSLSFGATSAVAAQDIPSNAHRNTTGIGWDCNKGYKQLGNNCEPVMPPAHAALDYWGHGWDCTRGYKQVGDECEPVILPTHAALDYWGHGWDCNKGYKQVGDECE